LAVDNAHLTTVPLPGPYTTWPCGCCRYFIDSYYILLFSPGRSDFTHL